MVKKEVGVLVLKSIIQTIPHREHSQSYFPNVPPAGGHSQTKPNAGGVYV